MHHQMHSRQAGDFSEIYRVTIFILRTEKASLPEKTRWAVRPSALIHFGGMELVSPGPTSHRSAKKAVVQGPQGSAAS